MRTESSSDSPWTFAGESAALGDSSVTLVDGTSFLVCSRSGDVTPGSVEGLFMVDTRVLSGWRLLLNTQRVDALSVSPNGPFSATFVGRVHDPATVDAPISVVQRRHVGHGMREDLEIRNYSPNPVEVCVELALTSDFASLFDVKAGAAPGVPTATIEPTATGVKLVARTDDGAVEATTISCSTEPNRINGDRLVWDVAIEAGERWTNCLLVGVVVEGEELMPSYGCGQPVDNAVPVSRLRKWRAEVTTIESDWPVLSAAVERSAEDLGALRIFDPNHPDRVVVAAGAPWFMTLFGRDSLFASWMALPLDQDLARGVLLELAESQGQLVDPTTEEQPGRILHEVRFDSGSSRLLGGTNIYYGTVDATPLFIMLVAELARWTGITPTIKDLMPAVDRALAWITDFGDRDGDGFIEYSRSDPSGLENQGWKDSWDGVRHRDGTVATTPIALCEAQGYVYAAYRGRAELGRALGEPVAATTAFDARADHLRDAFDAAFWLDDGGWYAIGLDSMKSPIGSLTSNIGHLLWTGIVPDHRAGQLAEHLASRAMFSGWGLRTLAENAKGYNPLSYHCGSVWPHDTALAVAGLARYGCDSEAQLLTEGLLAASLHSGGRLPELFAGFARDDLPSPIPYPASCSPQAWAAASPLLLVRAMLGLEPNLLTGTVRLRPRLGDALNRLQLLQVPLGNHRIDISVSGSAIEVAGLGKNIQLEVDGV
ncbi:MAG: amylo-alpha-1,6-glucosidase [Acidimicrobiales bacterium]|nr:amylo-alpha-1,6-glucosidase [Acidimicrobiales bacterium]